MRLSLGTGPILTFGEPVDLFSVSQRAPYPFSELAIAPSGNEFLFLKPADVQGDGQLRVHVITNWGQELTRLAPAQ